tara:strand:+ start:487 stop:747 length:261 start_codon:yes stop_codon:yes gene_type:complete
MTEAWALIVAALVTGAFGVLSIFVRNFRHENRRDHAEVTTRLKNMAKSLLDVKVAVDKNGDVLTDHLDWHKTPKRDARKKKSAAKK